MVKEKIEDDITKKLQNLVKKKKVPLVVIKAGSIKPQNSTSGSSSSDYYPSSDE